MKIEFYKRKDGDHSWRVRADNGEIVIPPEGYKNKSDMEDTVAVLRDGLCDAEIVEV